MRQVRFWAIAPIALLATFSAQPTVSSPVSDSVGISKSRSSTHLVKSPAVTSAGNAVLAQASPKSPSPQQSPTQTPTIDSPIPDPQSFKVILEQLGELTPAKSSVLPSDSSLYDEYTFEGNQGQTVGEWSMAPNRVRSLALAIALITSRPILPPAPLTITGIGS
jgi:hypothetical protein